MRATWQVRSFVMHSFLPPGPGPGGGGGVGWGNGGVEEEGGPDCAP
jgi:hypothetical protein